MARKKQISINDLLLINDAELLKEEIKTIDKSLLNIVSKGGSYSKITHPIVKKDVYILNSDLYILTSLLIYFKRKEYGAEVPSIELIDHGKSLILLLKKIDSYNDIIRDYKIEIKDGHFCIL